MTVKKGKGKGKSYWLYPNVVTFLLFSLSPLASSFEESRHHEGGFFKVQYDEKTALVKFRALVRPFLRDRFMNEDSYLMRWLRSKDFNIPRARQTFMENLRWRRAHNIDAIIKEDFSDMAADYPYYYGSRDKIGRPIAIIPIGNWNVRRAAITGSIPRLIRYMTKLLEINKNNIEESMDEGSPVSEFKIIADLNGFNVYKHACPLCLPVYSSFVRTLQGYYPGYTNQFVLVNTPPAFQTVLGTIKPLLGPRLRRAFKVFGRNKDRWTEYLEKDVGKDVLEMIIGHYQ